MKNGLHIVVCGGIVPDPLQTLEPVTLGGKPTLKNELMLPAVIDPWSGHALYEAAHLAGTVPGTRVWLISLAPKAKLQQVMMLVAQKAPFEFVAIDGSGSGFTDAYDVAAVLADAIAALPGLNRSRLLVFGGWESASRCAGATLQMIGERLGVVDQFQGVDRLVVGGDGSLEVLERVEGGRHQMSTCVGPPAVLGWATGSLPEPPTKPQVGMANMRNVMPALQRAQPARLPAEGLSFSGVTLPAERRHTKIVKDVPADEMARDIVAWITGH
jgi:electron transfer flavoprotein beta subunit